MDREQSNATLIVPENGYTNIELIEQCGNQWIARICGSGREIMVFEDEFTRDNE